MSAKSVAYDTVYKQIVAKMEAGVVPWRRPWKSARPSNATTNRPYNGINFFLLTCAGYEDGRWLTHKQLTGLGGSVKKGQKATQVVFWKMLAKEDDVTGKLKKIPYLTYYNVFNVEQTEGVDWDKVEITPNLDAEDIVNNYADAPEIKYGFDHASYSPSKDLVSMPARANFNSTNEYYSTLFHELAHSTGHQNRLSRKEVTSVTGFGSDAYSAEELVAEFSAAFLCSSAGIDNTLDQSTAYIKGWLKTFKEHPEMLVHAAGKAQKAVDYIMGVSREVKADGE